MKALIIAFLLTGVAFGRGISVSGILANSRTNERVAGATLEKEKVLGQI